MGSNEQLWILSKKYQLQALSSGCHYVSQRSFLVFVTNNQVTEQKLWLITNWDKKKAPWFSDVILHLWTHCYSSSKTDLSDKQQSENKGNID